MPRKPCRKAEKRDSVAPCFRITKLPEVINGHAIPPAVAASLEGTVFQASGALYQNWVEYDRGCAMPDIVKFKVDCRQILSMLRKKRYASYSWWRRNGPAKELVLDSDQFVRV